MTVHSIDLNSVNTYQAITQYKNKSNDALLLAKIGYSSFCDAGVHSWHAMSKLPSAIIKGQVSHQILHVKRALAHLALLASLPFSFIKPASVINTAELLGLKKQTPSMRARIKTAVKTPFNESISWIRRHPQTMLGLCIGAGSVVTVLAYAAKNGNTNSHFSPPAKQNNPIKPPPSEVSISKAIIWPLIIGGASLYAGHIISGL